MYCPLVVNKQYKDITYYSNKIKGYSSLLNDELSNDEKSYVIKKLKKIEEKLKSIRLAEEENIKNITSTSERLRKEDDLNKYSVFITNRDIYFTLRDSKKDIPESFKYIYTCYDTIYHNSDAFKEDMPKKLNEQQANLLHTFTTNYTQNFNVLEHPDIFNIFLV